MEVKRPSSSSIKQYFVYLLYDVFMSVVSGTMSLTDKRKYRREFYTVSIS